MIQLGMIQTLEIVKTVEFGVYLGDGVNQEERILLPKKQVPQNARIGDKLEVFVYRDSKDRLIATTNRPKLTLGGVARLKVAQVGKIGAFLEWGLEKDLLLPFKEQTKKVSAQEECLAALYIDKSDRLCATMRIYPYLDTDSPYQKDDRVRGTVYEVADDYGAYVAVDDRYSALIPKRELYREIRVGDVVEARVVGVKDDGKLDLSVREKAYLQIGEDAGKVLELLDRYGGVLPFNDKASPEVIKREVQMSKNEFKRAVGHLLKTGKIKITEKTIEAIYEQ